jgi:small-conductance mechanosensitive channel
MDYLRAGEESAHPEIRAVAVELATRTSKHELKQGARVSPNLILWVDLVLGVAAALACWYAYLHYSEHIASQLTSICIRVYLVIVGISLLLTGHLSQANFMKILGWLESQAKSGLSRIKRIGGRKREEIDQSDKDVSSK